MEVVLTAQRRAAGEQRQCEVVGREQGQKGRNYHQNVVKSTEAAVLLSQ